MSLSSAVGAPSPITIGDKEYQASPLDFGDLGIIEENVRALILQAAAKGAIGLPQLSADHLVDRALNKAAGVAYYDGDAVAFMKTPGGQRLLISLSLLHQHREMNAMRVGEATVRRQDQVDQAIATIFRISGFSGNGGVATGEAASGKAQT